MRQRMRQMTEHLNILTMFLDFYRKGRVRDRVNEWREDGIATRSAPRNTEPIPL